MNSSTLTDFDREILQIKEYIKHVNHTDELVSLVIPITDDEGVLKNDDLATLLTKVSVLQNHYTKGFGRDKRIFVYKSIIITLYGILEKYIEIWVKDYLSVLSSITSYHTLSERFKISHFKLSMKLIELVIDGKWDKYQHLRKEDILITLHNCIQNPSSYSLNVDAFLIQSGNLKHKRICEIFKHLELDLNEYLIKNEELNNEIGIEQNKIANTEKDILYSEINEIVIRRNIIAHGSAIVDILDNTAIMPYVNFMEKYCKALFKALQEKLYSIELANKYFRIELVHNVWNNKIVGCRIQNYHIKTGQEVIIRKSDGSLYKTPILELEKDSVSYPELDITNKTDIAFKINLKVNTNCKFFLKNQLSSK